MTRSTKRCLHCRVKLRRVRGIWKHPEVEDAQAWADHRALAEARSVPS